VGAAVLELYAGTGALGIEALSRGAVSAAFVEGNRSVARRLTENLEALGLAGRGRVRVAHLERGVLPPGLSGPWGLVFLDPPYDEEAGPRWIRRLGERDVLDADGLLVYECRKGTVPPPPAAFTLATERTYGDTSVAIYRARGAAPGGST
jgi:16S rRNA (guanine966-N2)-methyltransferase